MSMELQKIFQNKKFLICNASGVLSSTLESLEKWIEAGVDAIVTKTVTYEPRAGYDDPVVAIDGERVVQAMGLPNPGFKEMKKRIEELKKSYDTFVIASFTGHESDEIIEIVETLGEVADGLEFNISCPHVKGVGSSVGFDFELLHELCDTIYDYSPSPFGLKCPYYPTDEMLQKLVDVSQNASFYTCINSIGKAMMIGKNYGVTNKLGGLSGKAIKPVAIGQVYRLRKLTNKYIFGCGGIADRYDAAEFLKAGANGIQLGSGILHYSNLKDFVEEVKKAHETKLGDYFRNMKKSEWD